MTNEMRREATADETLAEPFVDMDEGDRLALIYTHAEPSSRSSGEREANRWLPVTPDTYPIAKNALSMIVYPSRWLTSVAPSNKLGYSTHAPSTTPTVT